MQVPHEFPTFYKKLNPNFLQELQKLQEEKKRRDPTEMENKEKIAYAIKLLKFSEFYWKDINNNLLISNQLPLTHAECSTWESLRLTQFRQVFRYICELLTTLPETVISNYEALLVPNKKFTRKTFEYFAALMKVVPRIDMNFIIINIPEYTNEIHEYFKFETCEREKIIEAALETTVIPKSTLIYEFLLFLEINYKELDVLLTEDGVRKKFNCNFRFDGIYAITKRVIDTYNLHQLCLLATPLVENTFFTKVKSSTSTLFSPPKDTRTPYQFQFSQHPEKRSTQQKFALLRTLQCIGELLTGKHLQNKISALEESIDWNIFITIRDTLSHQENCDVSYYYDTYNKVLAFMDNDGLMLLVEMEINVLLMTFLKLVALRYKKTNAYIIKREQSEQEYKKFWCVVLEEETRLQQDEIVMPKCLLSKAEINILKSGLKPNLSKEDLKLVEDIILGNVDFETYTSEEKGRYKEKLFVSKKDNKILREECVNLLNQINERKKNIIKERIERDRKEKSEKDEKLKALRNNNEQTSSLRELVACFTAHPKEKKNCGHRTVLKASIRYLLEVKAMLDEVDKDWNNQNFKNRLLEKLSSNRVFKYAFDYCISQSISMIISAKEKIEAVGECEYFKKYGNEFRNLRNWIEHGNAILDFFEEDFEHDSTSSSTLMCEFRNTVSCTLIIHMIILLLPQLSKVLQAMPTPMSSQTVSAVIFSEANNQSKPPAIPTKNSSNEAKLTTGVPQQLLNQNMDDHTHADSLSASPDTLLRPK